MMGIAVNQHGEDDSDRAWPADEMDRPDEDRDRPDEAPETPPSEPPPVPVQDPPSPPGQREPYVVGSRFFERAGRIGNQKQHAPEVCR
jgi:hypothetical protein